MEPLEDEGMDLLPEKVGEIEQGMDEGEVQAVMVMVVE
jgi:hypothetical protein